MIHLSSILVKLDPGCSGVGSADAVDERERLWVFFLNESFLTGVEVERVADLSRRAACNSGWDRLATALRVLRDLGGEGGEL
jgi:hypothetical protein